MKDTIYRVDAIEAVESVNKYYSNEKLGYVHGLIKNRLKELPSAEAVQGWIPCSERLPSESGTYLTTTAKGSVCTDHYYANSTDLGDRHWSYRSRREPIAWMPLPKPFKGGDDE